MEKSERKKIMEKKLAKMKFFPMEIVYVAHDTMQIPYHIFSVSFLPDASIRYMLRCGEAFSEVTEEELLSEPNPFFFQEQQNEEND